MLMKPPTLPANHVNAPSYGDLVNALELIRHATAPKPDDGGHHEAAHDLADGVLKRVEARRRYEAVPQHKADCRAGELEDDEGAKAPCTCRG